jgi:hypothetical protein
MNDDLEGQMSDIAGQIYEDQVGLVVIGESEPCNDGSINISAAGATILPEDDSASVLIDCLVETMAKSPTLRDIIKLAVVRYDERNRPNPICLN